MADIEDGSYILGNTMEKPTTTKTDFKVLRNDLGFSDAYIYYDDEFNSNVPLVEGVDKGLKLDQWDITQTDTPGYYKIKTSVNSQESGNVGYLGLSDSDSSPKLNLQGNNLRIYKVDDSEDLKVLITDGVNRLRYKDGKFLSVPVSTPLEVGDYHYLGREEDDYLKFRLTTPTEHGDKATWMNNVRLQERILVKDLADENGMLSFEKAQPKGYVEKLGPAGRIYRSQNDGELSGLFENLYRLDLSKGELPTTFDRNILKDPYAEYAFIGYKLEIDGVTYLLDKEAEFIKATQDDKDGIEIESSGLKVLDADGGEVPVADNLFIPFESDSVFETRWLEISSPLYFYYNALEGILDLERSIRASELLERENIPINQDFGQKLSPMMAEGRLLFPVNRPIGDPKADSSITMDYKIREQFRNVMSIDFPERLNEKLDDKYINQIIFDNVVDVENSYGDSVSYEELLNDYETSDFITSNMVKARSVNWIKNSSNEAGLLKYDIDDKTKPLIYHIPKERLDTDKLDIDYLTIEKGESGALLKGILYSLTETISVEKTFKNVTDDEFEALRTGNGDASKRFEIKLLLDQDTTVGGSDRDVLYTLAFNRGSNGGNTQMTPYPEIGGTPLGYWDIERVETSVSKAVKRVAWSITTIGNQDYYFEERNAQSGPKDKDLYVRIKEYSVGQRDPKVIDKYYKSSDIGTESIITPDKLNSSKNDMVRFTNHYSSRGALIINTFDRDSKQPLKGRTFSLYKVDGENETKLGEGISCLEGFLTFSDLEEGSYILRENEETRDPIYNELGDIKFDIVRESVNGKEYYLLENGTAEENKEIEFKAFKPEDGKTVVENVINIPYITSTKAITVRKIFDNLPLTEIKDITNNTVYTDKPFKVIVKGYKDGKEYSRELNFKNSSGLSYNTELSWKINTLAKDNEEINIFDSNGNFTLDYITIEEEGYEHPRHPVTKRKAKFEGKEIDIQEYPYKLEANDFTEDGSATFEIKNHYTDVFSVMIQVRGRDLKNQRYIPVENMGFQLYGGIDESNIDTQGRDFGSLGRQYLLEKPIEENPMNDEKKREFLTDEKGQREIFNMAMFSNNMYILDQSKNPADMAKGDSVVYYAIENPFVININSSDGILVPELYSYDPVKDELLTSYDSVKGQVETKYDGGTLFILIDLDRSNYRLPETGSFGRDKLYKVAIVTIILSSALLIYKNKKRREQW